MISSGKRFQFQLTPLLDLLLIVIFAQYLDVQQQADRQALQSVEQVSQARQRLEQETAELQRRLNLKMAQEQQLLQSEIEKTKAERQRLAQRESELKAAEQEAQQRVTEMASQQNQAANLIARVFDLPDQMIEQALRPIPSGLPARSEQETTRLRERFDAVAKQRGQEVVEFLLSYDELRKRADVWSLRVLASGEIEFTTDQSTTQFRADSPDDFVRKFYEHYEILPQPKTLVVILVSFGDALASVRNAVITGLPDAIRRMREDRLGQTQFEYKVLGYLPQN